MQGRRPMGLQPRFWEAQKGLPPLRQALPGHWGVGAIEEEEEEATHRKKGMSMKLRSGRKNEKKRKQWRTWKRQKILLQRAVSSSMLDSRKRMRGQGWGCSRKDWSHRTECSR